MTATRLRRGFVVVVVVAPQNQIADSVLTA